MLRHFREKKKKKKQKKKKKKKKKKQTNLNIDKYTFFLIGKQNHYELDKKQITQDLFIFACNKVIRASIIKIPDTNVSLHVSENEYVIRF